MNTLPEVPLISPDDRVRQHLRVAPMGREVDAVEPRDARHQLLCQHRHLRISGEQMRMKISMHTFTTETFRTSNFAAPCGSISCA